jgi:hypothetical protein
VFTARYALSPYIKQIRFVFKGLKWRRGFVKNVTDFCIQNSTVKPCVHNVSFGICDVYRELPGAHSYWVVPRWIYENIRRIKRHSVCFSAVCKVLIVSDVQATPLLKSVRGNKWSLSVHVGSCGRAGRSVTSHHAVRRCDCMLQQLAYRIISYEAHGVPC